MIRRPPRSTQSRSSAASDVYKRQTNEALIKKAARAQLLSSAGLKQSEIAKELGNVTTRTVRRYLSYELPDELTLPPSEVELAARVQFVERAWPLVLDLVNYVDSQLKAGELKGRDALVLSLIHI